MDLTTLIGILVAIGLMLYGIGFASLIDFWDFQSVVITIGGTFAGMIASFPLRVLKEIPKHIKIAFFGGSKFNAMRFIDTICEFAQIARKNGLLALEEKANQEKDEFLKSSVLLIVDAVDADKVRQILNDELDYVSSRHEEAISLYERGAAFGPAFGMIGTLIGLIKMLKSLDVTSGDASSSLGQGMSVALITTFYGSFLANVLFTPIASKLKVKNDEEMLCKNIIVEGVLSIQSGENPKYIREKLTSLLSRGELKTAKKKSKGATEAEK